MIKAYDDYAREYEDIYVRSVCELRRKGYKVRCGTPDAGHEWRRPPHYEKQGLAKIKVQSLACARLSRIRRATH
jgi:hypothetical protein